MAKNTVPKKLENSASKIANIVDFLLNDGHIEWKVDEFRLTPKNATDTGNVVCKYVKEDGEWVLNVHGEISSSRILIFLTLIIQFIRFYFDFDQNQNFPPFIKKVKKIVHKFIVIGDN
ncbi:MAG: hypothetical protein JWQ09_2326 [Segetibacter sp.]|nr:hypothetical protein [Segetibacter sp.]